MLACHTFDGSVLLLGRFVPEEELGESAIAKELQVGGRVLEVGQAKTHLKRPLRRQVVQSAFRALTVSADQTAAAVDVGGVARDDELALDGLEERDEGEERLRPIPFVFHGLDGVFEIVEGMRVNEALEGFP